jgi:putative transposase
VPEVAKNHGGQRADHLRLTEAPWQVRELTDMKRLQQLEQENGRLKKMVADRELEIDVLKEFTR